MALFYDPTTTAGLLGVPIWLIAIASIWSIIWKGLALWKSARLRQPIWFVVILVINTLGILEILYIFLFSKIKLDEKKPTRIKASRTTSRKVSSKKTNKKSKKK